MKVINKGLLKEAAKPGLCECCGAPCPDGRDPHHLMTKGAGRVDVRSNIVSLCRVCHVGFHASGTPSFEALIVIAAMRDKTTPNAIMEMVYRIRADDTCKVWRVS